MKGVWLSVLIGVWLIGAASVRADTFGPINVTAQVNSAQSLDCTILENNQTGNIVTAMNFGPLAEQPAFGTLHGTKFFQFHCGVGNNTGPYQVTQTGGLLTSGGNTLASGAWIVTPLSGVGGNPGVPLPAGTTVGTCGTAASVGKVLFSQANGTSVSDFSFTYGITDDPANCGTAPFITIGQPAGTYTTTVTITLQ